VCQAERTIAIIKKGKEKRRMGKKKKGKRQEKGKHEGNGGSEFFGKTDGGKRKKDMTGPVSPVVPK